MKIDNLLRSRSTPRTVTKTDKTQAGKFQQALGALPQEPKDTIAISHRVPAVEEAPAGAAAFGASGAGNAAAEAVRTAAPQTASLASPTEIQPGDSIDTKLAKLQKQAEEADYTGMSYHEIFASIWDRYNEAFDGNWATINSFPAIQEKGCQAASDFRIEVNRHITGPLQQEFKAETGITLYCGSMKNEEDTKAFQDYVQSKYGSFYAQVLGYGGMTIEETEQAIYQKYAGKDTLRDFLGMQAELFETGVMTSKLGGDGAWAYSLILDEQLNKSLFPDIYYDFSNDLPMNIPQSRWDAVLDGKFDARAFAADMRESLKSMTFSGWNFDIEGAISKGIDYLLEAVAKAQLAEQERNAELEKRAGRAELAERAE